MNHITICGNLGGDPELRTTNSGKSVCEFSMASTNRDRTTWFKVVCWDRQAEIAHEYLRKGDKPTVFGRMESEQWEDNDGNNRLSWKVTAFNIVLPQRERGASSGTLRQESPRSEVKYDQPFRDEDLPW